MSPLAPLVSKEDACGDAATPTRQSKLATQSRGLEGEGRLLVSWRSVVLVEVEGSQRAAAHVRMLPRTRLRFPPGPSTDRPLALGALMGLA
jgi:hypothetical protein